VREQETIIHNTGDEPILVEQADGTQMIVRPGEKRQARLLSKVDFANPAIPIYPDARRDPPEIHLRPSGHWSSTPRRSGSSLSACCPRRKRASATS